MQTYKFRGRSVETGEYVYGDLIQDDNAVWIQEWNGGKVEVYSETVAQLIGKDKHGREVYEGDKVINPTNKATFRAGLHHVLKVQHYKLVAA